jgi:hypothetical protein
MKLKLGQLKIEATENYLNVIKGTIRPDKND